MSKLLRMLHGNALAYECNNRKAMKNLRAEGVTADILNEYIEGSFLYRVSVKLGLSL